MNVLLISENEDDLNSRIIPEVPLSQIPRGAEDKLPNRPPAQAGLTHTAAHTTLLHIHVQCNLDGIGYCPSRLFTKTEGRVSIIEDVCLF